MIGIPEVEDGFYPAALTAARSEGVPGSHRGVWLRTGPLIGFLSVCLAHLAPSACIPVTIVTPPATQFVPLGCPGLLTVEVAGSEPVSFQWTKDGVSIPGATNASYLTPGATDPAHPLTGYAVVVENGCSAADSPEVSVVTFLDTVSPRLGAVHPGARPDELIVSFITGCASPNPLDPATLLDLANYSLSGGLVVSNVTTTCNGSNVVLRISRPVEGNQYTLTVQNVRDLSGNVLFPNPSQVTFRSDALARGFLRREVFREVWGSSIADLTNVATFPYCPEISGLVTSFEAPSQWGDRYGQRLSGWILPPTTTNYIFWLAADDQAALFLSTDDSPDNKRPITALTAAVPPRAWRSPSAAVPLIAGSRYYVEALMKENSAADHLAVAWQVQGGQGPRPGRDVIPGTYLVAYTAGGVQVNVVQQPQSVTVSADCRASFTVGATATPAGSPLAYQWQRNSVDIPGANSATCVTAPLGLADNSTVYRCIIRAAGVNRVSANAFLTVLPDVFPPKVSGAVAISPTRVLVFFNKGIPLPPASSFQFECVTVLAVRPLDSDNPSVVELILAGEGLVAGACHNLRVQSIRDLSGNSLDPDPSSMDLDVWPELPTVPTDVLRLIRAGERFVVEWPGMGTLQAAESLLGPWVDLPDAFSPAVFFATQGLCGAPGLGPYQFYRVRLATP
jgi:hypothetical protein